MSEDLEIAQNVVNVGMAPRKIFVFGDPPALIELSLMQAPRYSFADSLYNAFVTSPHDADILLVYGPVTYKQAAALKSVYGQMAHPKIVVAVGTTPLFKGYHFVPSIEELVPVDYYFANIYPGPTELSQLANLCIPRSNV